MQTIQDSINLTRSCLGIIEDSSGTRDVLRHLVEHTLRKLAIYRQASECKPESLKFAIANFPGRVVHNVMTILGCFGGITDHMNDRDEFHVGPCHDVLESAMPH